MTLSKLELQQMLREMNVKFSADETYEELKHRLQQENHSLWLKSVSKNRTANGGRSRVVVRRRKETRQPAGETDASGTPATKKKVSPFGAREGGGGMAINIDLPVVLDWLTNPHLDSIGNRPPMEPSPLTAPKTFSVLS